MGGLCVQRCVPLLEFTLMFWFYLSQGNFTPVQGTEFCSVPVHVQHFACSNGSVMFIEKLNVITDTNLQCLHQLQLYCNTYRRCNVPASCAVATAETRILYGCIPDIKNEKEHMCSDRTLSRDLEDQIFLVTPRKMKNLRTCNWRLRTLTNGVLILYALNSSRSAHITFHHGDLSKQTLLYRTLTFQVSANKPIDLLLSPLTKTWIVAKVIHSHVKDTTLEDLISCPIPVKPHTGRSYSEILADQLAGYKIAVIVLCCVVLLLLVSLTLTVYCFCKRHQTQSAESSSQRRSVIPYQTTLVNGAKNNKLNNLNHNVVISSPKQIKKEGHTYDHLDRYDTSYAVRYDPDNTKPKDDEDSESEPTYAIVGDIS
ncbi:uncharacterized protein LOC115221306 [Argonauta hians]